MDEQYANARELLFLAVGGLAASADPIESRLLAATEIIVQVTIDQFDSDAELKLRFARILDALAIDQDDQAAVAIETAAHMPETEALRIADMICDLSYDM
jgi:hypothetical protein